MADLFDYLKWRGDLSFTQVPPCPVDGLIFSALAYIRFGGSVVLNPGTPISLWKASEEFFRMEDQEARIRVKNDHSLLMAAAETRRFGETRLCHYRDILEPEKETQFAALTFLLDDGSAFLAFRGTDYSLVGWKEDFNMSFQETVPAQRLALDYTEEVGGKILMPLRLGGHSKGGNLAVFAAVKADPGLRHRIMGVYNNDGPGFREYLMDDGAYKEMVPRIYTFVPQSSVIGMLLEHEEPYTIVKSKKVGLMQHELYTWELDGPDFVHMEEITAQSHFLNLTIKSWLADMAPEDRNRVVDTLFELLGKGETGSVKDMIQPKNLRKYFKTLSEDEDMRRLLSGELLNFIEAAVKTQQRISDPKQIQLEAPK